MSQQWRRRSFERIVILGMLSMFAVGYSAAQEIMLGPRAPAGHTRGPPDWDELFQPNAPWPITAAHTAVFGFSAEHIAELPPDRIAAEVAALRRRGTKIGITIMPLPRSPGACGTKIESYDRPDQPISTSTRLKSVGVTPDYIFTDEPLLFGHYVTDPTACQSPIPVVISQVASTLKTYLAAFPNVIIGDIETAPILDSHPTWKADYLTFKHGVEAAIGRKLSFLHFDVNWHNPAIAVELGELARFTRDNGMKFGVIYNGDSEDHDDQAWMQHAERNFVDAESRYGVIPDTAGFASWNDHPVRVLPETDPTALTYLVPAYLKPRTVLTVQRKDTIISGRLTDASGAPIPGAEIAINRMGVAPGQVPPTRSVKGVVPATARFFLIGIRVNDECNCNGTNDLLIGDIVYTELRGGIVRQTFPLASDLMRRGGSSGFATPESVAGVPLAHLQIAIGQSFQTNSATFAVTPGVDYMLTAPLGSANGGGMFGSVIIIFLDADKAGISRAYLTLDESAVPTPIAKSGRSGRFSVNLAGEQAPCLLLSYAGSPNHRAATAPPLCHQF
jgi:hypothetical protein